MKKRLTLIATMMLLTIAASAQIQLLYMNHGRNVIDRNKKLYWMEGDSDPCFDILSYKKAGNKETFTLKEKEKGGTETYNVTITLNDKSVPVHIVIKAPSYVLDDSDVRTTSGNVDEDNRMYKYFGELAGYPPTANIGTSAPSVTDIKQGGAKGATAKVGETVKGAVGKVKGLFKKKK